MEETSTRIWQDLIGRIGGPMTFRIILQPAMALGLAIRDGWKDAKAGRPPYFWDLFTGSHNAGALLREGWRAIARVFLLAIGIDLIYQHIVFRRLYPFEAVIVAIVLAILPYLLLRGPVDRMFHKKKKGNEQERDEKKLLS